MSPQRQSFIHRGRKLVGDDDKTVFEIAGGGLKEGGKIMLIVSWGKTVSHGVSGKGEEKGKAGKGGEKEIGREVEKGDDGGVGHLRNEERLLLRRIEKITGKFGVFEKNLNEVENHLLKLERGYLSEAQAQEVCRKLTKKCKLSEEGVMRILEELDGVVGGDCGNDGRVWRAQRKVKVVEGQGLLSRCDGLVERIEKVRHDEWDEIESRRGVQEKRRGNTVKR